MAQFRILSFLAVLIALFTPPPALAGLEKAADTCDSDCAAALADFAPKYFAEHAPVLATAPGDLTRRHRPPLVRPAASRGRRYSA